MAATNHTASATNNDINTASPSVPQFAATAPGAISRRTLMQLGTSAAAIPALAFLPTEARASARPDRSAWDRAVAELKSAEAEYSRLSEQYRAAEAAFAAEAGEPNPDFETYGVDKGGPLRTRDGQIRFVEVKIAMTDYAGQHVSPDDYAAIAKKAAQLVDDYEAHLERRGEAEGRILDGPQTAWEASLDVVGTARRALWQTPAPDAEAMLLKLELLADYMAEGCDDFAAEVAAIRTDARSLWDTASTH